MRKALRYVGRIIQVLTVIGSVFAVIETLKAYNYKKHLKNRAEVYLDDELELEGNIRGSVNVYSPTLENKEQKAKKLVLMSGVGLLLSIVLNVINREY